MQLCLRGVWSGVWEQTSPPTLVPALSVPTRLACYTSHELKCPRVDLQILLVVTAMTGLI